MDFPLDITEAVAAKAKCIAAENAAIEAAAKAHRVIYDLDKILEQHREGEATLELIKAFAEAMVAQRASDRQNELDRGSYWVAMDALDIIGFEWKEAFTALRAVVATPSVSHEFESKSGKKATVVRVGERLLLAPVAVQHDLFEDYESGGLACATSATETACLVHWAALSNGDADDL